ncbi:WecB/TagA/CpsF family glycosyltransferase [Vacuolonema iberomarrocanum]|uniref:WecB/TagA/CpsF family glycosyltransferase n=1 Tax=Vacuolonema iberomarrocanum TaxID=3454632 RepID=UPI001A06F6AA|nr:WecB/TagA/CpsF family glycosyltransferase [filamentous cyanobacterium LEGE 07170]
MTTQFSSPSQPELVKDSGFPEVVVLQTKFHQLTCCDLIEYVTSVARDSTKKIVANVNVRAMNFACDLPWYQEFINRADVVFCDGFGVLLAAKLNGYDLESKHRMTCPDYIENLAKTCEKRGRSLFLLAGQPGVVEKAIAQLSAIAPDLKIDGHHGFFEKTGAENDAVIEKINQFNPDLLYVGFGMPTQERWILDNIDTIDATVFLPLGACLDFYTGTVRRGPKFLTDNGFEWLSRLLIEPRRLWSRYIVGNTLFFYRVLKELGWKAFVSKS